LYPRQGSICVPRSISSLSDSGRGEASGDAILHAEKHVRNETCIDMLGDTIHVATVHVPRSIAASVIVIEKVRRERISSYGIVAGCSTSAEGPAIQRLSSIS